MGCMRAMHESEVLGPLARHGIALVEGTGEEEGRIVAALSSSPLCRG